MADRFWVNGGDGLWGSTNNWSTTDGGGGGSSVPGSGDDARFTANSPNCTVNTGGTRQCRQLIMTGWPSGRTMTLNTTLTVGPQNTGVCTLAASTTWTGSGQLAITGTTAATLTSAGAAINCSISIGNNGVTYTFADNWDVNGTLICGNGVATNNVFNGSQINFSGNLTMSSGGNYGGTTVFNFDGAGTGTWTSTTGVLISPLTINCAGTFVVSGTVRYGTGTITYTAGTVTTTGSTLLISLACTFNCAAITWENITVSTGGGIVTFTLSADLNLTGTFTSIHSGGVQNTFNGNNINNSGSLTISGGQINGTTVFKMTGTGTISCTTANSQIRSALTINTSGTITFSGTVRYNGATLTYTAGSLAGASTPILDVAVGTATVFDWGGTVALPFTVQVNTAGITLNLASGMKIGSTGGLTGLGTAASVATIKSNSGGTQRKLTITPGATIDVGYTNFTDIDCSDGDRLWVFKGTLSNTTRISQYTPYVSPFENSVINPSASYAAIG